MFRCSDNDCTDGDIYPVGGGANSDSNIVVPADGLPLITYSSGRRLQLLDCANSDCSTAERRTLDDNDFTGADNSLALNADGLAVVSYFDSNNRSLKTYACDDIRCTSGKADTIDATGEIGQHTATTLRPGDAPIITYYDNTNTALKAYVCIDQGCAETVLADGFE